MKRWKSAGLWLAVFACAGLAGWGCRQWEDEQARQAAKDAATPRATPPRARVHMPISLAPGRVAPTQFPLTREGAQRAARAGVLRVALADGTYYDVRVANESIDAQGHWSISGYARTALGQQAMVLTYGERAVFGTLPLPDGRVLQVRTEHGRALIGDHFNFAMPRAIGNQHGDTSSPGAQDLAPPNFGADDLSGSKLVDDAIVIRVLGAYTDDLLALHDNDAIATEFASMLAIANQAHVDSGSIVRFENAGLVAAGTVYADNESALHALPRNASIRDARNLHGADLVTLLRPRGKTDTACGAAYTAAARPTERDAYSVVDVAPCGPYTLAHFLGHNLGNAHDRTSDRDAKGVLRFGAYPFSFGHRHAGRAPFATLEAIADGLPVLGRFSNPRQACGDVACGVEDEADTVRGMALMATQVAAYSDPPATP